MERVPVPKKQNEFSHLSLACVSQTLSVIRVIQVSRGHYFYGNHFHYSVMNLMEGHTSTSESRVGRICQSNVSNV